MKSRAAELQPNLALWSPPLGALADAATALPLRPAFRMPAGLRASTDGVKRPRR